MIPITRKTLYLQLYVPNGNADSFVATLDSARVTAKIVDELRGVVEVEIDTLEALPIVAGILGLWDLQGPDEKPTHPPVDEDFAQFVHAEVR